MNITYARLINLGNYENERIEVEDEVRADETPVQAYARIRAEAWAMIGRRDPTLPELELEADDDGIPY